MDAQGGATMARPLLDDELWNVIEPILPPPKPRRFKCPGRKPLDRRKTLTGVLFVLKTGIPWEDLPQEMGCGSGMSCWRYLNAWQEAGVWEKVHNALLGRLRAKERLDLSAAMVDSSHVRAVGGANVRVPAL
jgi:transposase